MTLLWQSLRKVRRRQAFGLFQFSFQMSTALTAESGPAMLAVAGHGDQWTAALDVQATYGALSMNSYTVASVLFDR